MQKMIFGLIRAAFAVLGRIAPGPATRLAFWLFRTPRARRPVPEAARRLVAAAETFELSFEDGPLRVFRWAPEDEPAGAVLLAHGWESRAGRLTEWVEPLLHRNLAVVALDGPAHGESSGRQVTPVSYARAIHRVAEHQLGEGKDPFLAIIGHSFGALSSAIAVANPKLAGCPAVAVDRLVLVAGPDRTEGVLERFGKLLRLRPRLVRGLHEQVHAQSGYPVAAFSVASMLAEVSFPVLIVHDRRDDQVPYGDAEAITAAAPTARLLTTDGLGHRRVMRDPKVIAEVLEFLTDGSGI